MGTSNWLGVDREEVGRLFEGRSREGRRFAETAAWAGEEAKIEGVGKKRRVNGTEQQPATRTPDGSEVGKPFITLDPSQQAILQPNDQSIPQRSGSGKESDCRAVAASRRKDREEKLWSSARVPIP